MRIERKRIHSLDRYLGAVPTGSAFRVVSFADPEKLSRAGFDPNDSPGATLLPAIVGRTTRINAEGSYKIRRDLPKENRYVGSREFTRMEWHGRDQVEVTDTVDYYRMCYPREPVLPQSLELTLAERAGELVVMTPNLLHEAKLSSDNRHAINVMLELFGSCEVVSETLTELALPPEKRANWVMLPPGEHPWERIAAHIERVFGRRSPTVASAVIARQEIILDHRPDLIYRGTAGFSDYIAYVFNKNRRVVLESVFYGNALYIFGRDWENLSRLTKAEIIQNELAEYRIVHNKGWQAALAKALN